MKPEIPIKGLCPLQIFNSKYVAEREGKHYLKAEVNNELLEKGDCHMPALWVAEGAVPNPDRFIDCAAIDTRKSYLSCELFLKWFWYTRSTKNKFPKAKKK